MGPRMSDLVDKFISKEYLREYLSDSELPSGRVSLPLKTYIMVQTSTPNLELSKALTKLKARLVAAQQAVVTDQKEDGELEKEADFSPEGVFGSKLSLLMPSKVVMLMDCDQSFLLEYNDSRMQSLVFSLLQASNQSSDKIT